MNAEVREGGEVLLVDGVPKSQLGGDPAVEVTEYVEAVCALRRRSQTKQLDRLQVVEERLVRRRRRVVELVHDHDVEVRRVDVAERRRCAGSGSMRRRARTARAVAADPLLAEGCVAQRVPERRTALVEDLLAVSDEQQAAAGELRLEVVRSRPRPSLSSRCR